MDWFVAGHVTMLLLLVTTPRPVRETGNAAPGNRSVEAVAKDAARLLLASLRPSQPALGLKFADFRQWMLALPPDTG
jgi:hypothetical protein